MSQDISFNFHHGKQAKDSWGHTLNFSDQNTAQTHDSNVFFRKLPNKVKYAYLLEKI